MPRTNALNINKLSKYNFKYISVEEILLLEYFIAYYQKNNLDIVVPNRIELETGLKRGKIEKASDELAEKGFINVKVEKLRTRYSINFENIIKNLEKLFVNSNKYALQYFYYVQNPNAFKTKANKAKKAKVVAKTKTKNVEAAEKQMSLF